MYMCLNNMINTVSLSYIIKFGVNDVDV